MLILLGFINLATIAILTVVRLITHNLPYFKESVKSGYDDFVSEIDSDSELGKIIHKIEEEIRKPI